LTDIFINEDESEKAPIDPFQRCHDMEIESVRNYQAGSSETSSVQEDRQRRFELDLELPHPDNYLPETVDFPSSPSAMMRNRFDEDLQHEKPSNTNHKLIILIHFQSGELKAIS